jgi:GNAT superfamily N-acetyltransferase
MPEVRAEAAQDRPARLRAMTAADIVDAVPLLAQLGYEIDAGEAEARVRAILAAPDHSLLVAERDGRAVALMHVFARPAIENPREAVVQAIVVDEDWRRAGIGRLLLAAAERWGREHDCRSLVLSSNVVRAPAHAFYAALGYRVAATAYVLRKELSRG